MADQTLYPGEFQHQNQLSYQHGADSSITLTASLFSSANVLTFVHNLIAVTYLTPALFTNSNTFYGGDQYPAVEIKFYIFHNYRKFWPVNVSGPVRQELTVARMSNVNSFYASSLIRSKRLRTAIIRNEQVYYLANVA